MLYAMWLGKEAEEDECPYELGEIIWVKHRQTSTWLCRRFTKLDKQGPGVLCDDYIRWPHHKPLTPTEKGII